MTTFVYDCENTETKETYRIYSSMLFFPGQTIWRNGVELLIIDAYVEEEGFIR